MVAVRTIGVLEVSLSGLGCGNFGFFIGEIESRAVVHAALDAGITHFDTADIYGEGLSEEYLGRALGARRGEVVITTKFGSSSPPGVPPGSAEWARHSCEASLARLGSDWIDLYLLHQPDPTTPISETLGALNELRKEGKLREIGCSNFDATQLDEAFRAAEALGMPGFKTVQNSYSLLDRTAETGLLAAAERLGANLLPYLPLASGMLTGKYRRGEHMTQAGRLGLTLRGTAVRDYFPALLTDECFDIVEALERYAESRGHRLAELALAWLASKPFVPSIISGATSPAQVWSNVEALSAWQLSAAELEDVDAMTRNDVAYTWNAGFPSYAQLPAGIDRSAVLDVRKQSTKPQGCENA